MTNVTLSLTPEELEALGRLRVYMEAPSLSETLCKLIAEADVGPPFADGPQPTPEMLASIRPSAEAHFTRVWQDARRRDADREGVSYEEKARLLTAAALRHAHALPWRTTPAPTPPDTETQG